VRDRFLEEARILRRADSDHVVRVYDIGEADGTPYFVMTYADRGTVADLLEREGSLPLDRSVALVSQAGAGLQVLHAQGSVHRDLKPANLLLRSDGPGTRVMVADLGVAKAVLHGSALTDVVGTPAYMAPEQASGGGVDERADVYALAAVSYHLLTGEHAYDGTIAGLARYEPPPSPSELADLPERVDDVVLRGLAADRDDRWPDVASFVSALRAAAPATAGTVIAPPARRGARTVPSRPSRAGSRALLVLLCLAVFVACFAVALAVTRQLR
jgi:serine/threonine protein kinase